MSHRLSQSARHTKELLEELERDKELDVLREYLTRFGLFPRKRDPAAAPIRFEELKELVKHWKLHRQRNFWKTHTTKEDLVRTLYRHINTKIIPQEIRDEGNATASGLAAPSGPPMTPAAPPARRNSGLMTDSPRSRSIAGLGARVSPPSSRGPRSGSVFSGYGGDLFGQRGDYEDGMIYLSRFRKPGSLTDETPDSDSLLGGGTGGDTMTLGLPELDEEDDEQEPGDDALDFGHGLSREIRLKQECAFSIYHFTTESGHERQVVTEGGMLALSKLSVFDDLEVKRFCAAAILNLTYEPTLGAPLADEGVLLALLELAKAQHEEVRRHTSMALCRFSYERGGQLRLVQEGCVSAILSMLNVPDLETKEACVKALINIASASGTTVAESVIQALMKLAARKDASSLRFAAEAICNLSLLSGPRAKALEDGVLDTLCDLVHQSSSSTAVSGERDVQEDEEGEEDDAGHIGRVRRHLATALCNFSGVTTNLEALSQVNTLECLEELLKSERPREVREMCAVAMANLSVHPPALRSLAVSDAVAHLVELGATVGAGASHAVRENTALCLANLATAPESRAQLARFGVVALLLRFLEDGEQDGDDCDGANSDEESVAATADGLAQQYAVLTLCSLLAHPSTCVELLQSNVPAALARLATRTPHTRVRELCATALFNVSCEKSLHAVLLQDATIRAIVRLCGRPDDADAAVSGLLLRHQESALGCLFNLSFAAENRATLLRADVVATLVALFHKPPPRCDELLRQCAGVLANLSFDAEARERMVADSGVRLLRRLMSAAQASVSASAAAGAAAETNATTCEALRSCATACCNLAAEALERTPVLDMLIDLSASTHAPTTLTCAMAFAKLASSAAHRGTLTRCAELYPALTLMMRCGVEDIQIYSAVALCNLAVEPPAARPVGARHVWKEGTVPDFIVNALLRINSDSTKEICARALFNLLTHDELRAAHIKDGVLYALVKLARLESTEIRGLCVTALYNLSGDPQLADTLMELNVAQVVAKLCEMEFSSQEIHRRLAACLSNLAASSAAVALRLVEGGALVALLVLCEHADPPTQRACAAALCFLSAQRANCEAMAALGLVDVLAKKLLLGTPVEGTTVDSQASAEAEEAASAADPQQQEQHRFALTALCNLSSFPALHDRMAEAGVVAHVVRLLAASASASASEEAQSDSKASADVLLACVQTLGNLTFHARHRRALLTHGLVPVLLRRPQVLQSSPSIGDVCAELLAALCEDAQHWSELVASGAVRVLRELAAGPHASAAARRASVYALSQLARCEKAGAAVLADGALDVAARALELADGAEARQETAERCAVTLRALATQGEAVCWLLMRDERLVPLLRAITDAACSGRRLLQTSKHVILALYNLTGCRASDDDNDDSSSSSSSSGGLDALVRGGVVPLLIRLSTAGGGDMAPACAVSLAHIKHRHKERVLARAATDSQLASPAPEESPREALDELMEDGVVAALLALLELDQAGIQRVDRLAVAMPPVLPVLRVASESDWVFLRGDASLRFEAPLPVSWEFRSSAVDDARFVPAEPRSFLAALAPVEPTTATAVQDKLHGHFQVMRVRSEKCRLALVDPRFAKQAAASAAALEAALAAGDSPPGSAGASSSQLSDAIALAIAEEPTPEDAESLEPERVSRRASRRSITSSAGSGRRASSGSVRSLAADADADADELRAPAAVKKKATGRTLLGRSSSSRGSAVFGVGATATSTVPVHAESARRSSKALAPNSNSRKELSHKRLSGAGGSGGVTLPKI